MKKTTKGIMLLTVASMVLTGCGAGGAYSGYSSAYNKVTANGGLDADFDVTITMDGETSNDTGNFKLDTSDGNNILYYEMEVGDDTITQFSDGEYIYTDAQEHKTKYSMNSKPSASSDKQETKQKDSSGTFNTSEFISQFSSFLEAGKIKELGMLSPIEQAAITDISEEGGVYTLTFSDSLVQKYLNLMIENETGEASGDTLSIDELNDFTYKATSSDDMITKVEYSGTMVVKVPASLMASGEETSYDLDFNIVITFNNPGEAVSIDLPSTDGYEEVK